MYYLIIYHPHGFTVKFPPLAIITVVTAVLPLSPLPCHPLVYGTNVFILDCESQKQDTALVSITSRNIARLNTKLSTKLSLLIQLYLKNVAVLPCETVMFQNRMNSKIQYSFL